MLGKHIRRLSLSSVDVRARSTSITGAGGAVKHNLVSANMTDARATRGDRFFPGVSSEVREPPSPMFLSARSTNSVNLENVKQLDI